MTKETDDDQSGSSAGEHGSNRDGFEVVRTSIVVLALAATVAFLHAARFIIVPIILAIFLAYVLDPLVSGLANFRFPYTDVSLPRSVSALIVVLVVVTLAGSLAVLMGNQVRQLGSELPRYRERITRDVAQIQAKVFELENRVERLLQPIRRDRAESDGGSGTTGAKPSSDGSGSEFGPDPPTSQNANRQIVAQRTSQLWQSLSSYLAGGLTGLMSTLAQILTCIFVLFFTLSEAPAIRQKLLNIMGTTDERRRAILEALHKVSNDVQGYLFGRFLINTTLALVVSLAFFAFGLHYALLVGILAGLLNFIPYVGPIVGMVFPALIAYMQFGHPADIFWATFLYLALTGIEGNVITPIVLGRHLQLNSLIVLLGVIFWGWLWGAIGMLLAIPILAVVRSLSERVEELEPVAEVLKR